MDWFRIIFAENCIKRKKWTGGILFLDPHSLLELKFHALAKLIEASGRNSTRLTE